MDALGDLCSRHQAGVFAYFLRRTASVDLAGELADETWAAARLAEPRFKPRAASPEAWLLAIARETLCESLRAGGVCDRSRRKVGTGMPAMTADRTAAARESALDERLAEFAVGLPPALAEVVTARVPAADARALAARLRARDETDARRAKRRVRGAPLLGRLRLAGR